MKLNDAGSVIWEGLLIIFPLCASLLLVLEVLRREVFQVVLAHTTCTEVRERALGEKKEAIESKTKYFLEKSVGLSHSQNILAFSKRNSFYLNGGKETRRLRLGLHSGGVVEQLYRYPQLIPIHLPQGNKHHSEVLQRCLFPF
jgi:hypothetical protein